MYAFWDLSPPLLLAFVQAAEPWWYCAFGFTWCVFSFGLSPTGSARLLSFTRPNRGDRVSFGFVHRVPPLLPPPIPSASIHSGCRIAVILRFQLRLCPIDTHQEIGDMVILRFRVSIVLYSGFYSELYFWVLFRTSHHRFNWSPPSQGRRTMVIPDFS